MIMEMNIWIVCQILLMVMVLYSININFIWQYLIFAF